MRVRLFAGLLLAGVALALSACGNDAPAVPAFAPTFGASGLVTDEFSLRDPSLGHLSADWVATSGSLFAQDGAGWTGALTPETNSAVFRLVSRRRDFADTRVTFDLRVDKQATSEGNPEHAYDGVHVWLRYGDPDHLYAVSVMRRDGVVAIKRKAGAYETLAQGRAAFPPGRWVPVVVAIEGSQITVSVNGRQVLAAEDTGDAALTEPGGVGVRGDNTEFAFRGFRAEPLNED